MRFTALLLLIFAAACGYEGGPTLTGSVESEGFGLTEAGYKRVENLHIRINGWDEAVYVDDSSRFTIDGIPTGDLSIEIEIDGIGGTLTLHDVQENEVVHLKVKHKKNSVTITILRRTIRVIDHVDDDDDSDSDGRELQDGFQKTGLG